MSNEQSDEREEGTSKSNNTGLYITVLLAVAIFVGLIIDAVFRKI